MINFYRTTDLQPYIHKVFNPTVHVTDIPYNSRVAVIGGTGEMKTNTLMNFIAASPNTYESILLCNGGVKEPFYEFLKEKLPGKIVTCKGLKQLPDCREVEDKREDEKDQILVVVDDTATEMQRPKLVERLEPYFIMGRKCAVTTWLLSQSFFVIPPLIRLQLSHLILKKVASQRTLGAILNEYSMEGIQRRDLVYIHRIACEPDPGDHRLDAKVNFLKINVGSPNLEGKFTRNFTDPFEIQLRENEETGDLEAVIKIPDWYKGTSAPAWWVKSFDDPSLLVTKDKEKDKDKDSEDEDESASDSEDSKEKH